MTHFHARLGAEASELPRPALCDAWTVDGLRFGDELLGLGADATLGRWPGDLETDALVRLAQAVGDDATWAELAATPPVAQRLAERARPQPLDVLIVRHLQHLQHVCHRPRLHLSIEEERLPVSRARRIPVRAVAELVSHPGDWEHRTLRSIQPSRVLARLVEDEWNLYENRVAVRLVDHLLAYLAKRIEELRKIEEALLTSRDHSDEARTSFWRARRVTTLWADSLKGGTQDALRGTMRDLELTQRDLLALLDSPLYARVPRRASVAISLKPTNVLVNDAHYRNVAALWRAWVKLGHKRQETNEQRAARRHREALACDRFVVHVIARAFDGLGWEANEAVSGSMLTRPGWNAVTVEVEETGAVALRSGAATLRLLPLCADLAEADGAALMRQLRAWDALDGEVVGVHVGRSPDLPDVDRAAGWSFARRAVLFGCSPWGIDSEERMTRLVNGWLNRAAVRAYPFPLSVRALPSLPAEWGWVRYEDPNLVAVLAPSAADVAVAKAWTKRTANQLTVQAQQTMGKSPVAPRRAIEAFQRFIDEAADALAGLDRCPVCEDRGHVEPRQGRQANGADATWWAKCDACKSEWGLRPCPDCGSRFRALHPQVGLDLQAAAAGTAPQDWPDKVLGRDVWAQPCFAASSSASFRCSACGTCSGGGCARCPQALG